MYSFQQHPSFSPTSQQHPQHYHPQPDPLHHHQQHHHNHPHQLALSPLPIADQLHNYQFFQQQQQQHGPALPLSPPFANQHPQFIPPPPPPILHRRASAPAFNLANSVARFDPQPDHPMSSYFAVPEMGGSSQSSSKAPRRRRSAAGSEPVKHRRTRSGCFTCRTRRVKCDETHPICERCQKGGRECTYPEVVPQSSKSSNSRRRDKSTASREGSSSLEDVEEEDEEYVDAQSPRDNMRSMKRRASATHLRASARRDSWPAVDANGRRRSRNRKSDRSPFPDDSSGPTSPADSHGMRRTASAGGFSGMPMPADWSHLPHDVAFYLNFHRHYLTCHHYFQKHDTGFFKGRLFEHALKNEALLYAVVAFSAFHYHVRSGSGAFQTFLEFYNKSVSLLRASLDPDRPKDTATIVTILQLASFEEYLGDWMSLMDHRNAASKLLTSLWTPKHMAESEENRTIFNWFMHFDVIASMMAGHQTALPQEWSEANLAVVSELNKKDPDNIPVKVYLAMCEFQELAVEASVMTAKRSANQITLEEFVEESEKMLARCDEWRNKLDPMILADAVKLQPKIYDEEDEGLICPFEPAPLYVGVRWGVNFMLLDYYGLLILLNHQRSITNAEENLSLADTKTLAGYASKICEIIAAMEAYPDTPAGSILAAQAPIGLAALWVPLEYRPWMQKQLANCEQLGFVFPLAFRTRMAELWQDPKVKHTWVSSSSETPIGLAIHRLVDDRDSEMPPGDSARSDIREMRSLMKAMQLDSKGSGQMGVLSPASEDGGKSPLSPYSQKSAP